VSFWYNYSINNNGLIMDLPKINTNNAASIHPIDSEATSAAALTPRDINQHVDHISGESVISTRPRATHLQKRIRRQNATVSNIIERENSSSPAARARAVYPMRYEVQYPNSNQIQIRTIRAPIPKVMARPIREGDSPGIPTKALCSSKEVAPRLYNSFFVVGRPLKEGEEPGIRAKVITESNQTQPIRAAQVYPMNTSPIQDIPYAQDSPFPFNSYPNLGNSPKVALYSIDDPQNRHVDRSHPRPIYPGTSISALNSSAYPVPAGAVYPIKASILYPVQRAPLYPIGRNSFSSDGSSVDSFNPDEEEYYSIGSDSEESYNPDEEEYYSIGSDSDESYNPDEEEYYSINDDSDSASSAHLSRTIPMSRTTQAAQASARSRNSIRINSSFLTQATTDTNLREIATREKRINESISIIKKIQLKTQNSTSKIIKILNEPIYKKISLIDQTIYFQKAVLITLEFLKDIREILQAAHNSPTKEISFSNRKIFSLKVETMFKTLNRNLVAQKCVLKKLIQLVKRSQRGAASTSPPAIHSIKKPFFLARLGINLSQHNALIAELNRLTKTFFYKAQPLVT